MKSTSLFSSRPMRSRMTVMLTGSVLAHLCLAQLGASLWRQSFVEREPDYPTVNVFDPPPPAGPPEQVVYVDNPVPTPLVENVTPPPVVEPPVTPSTPPPVDDLEMTEPTPLPRTHAAPTRVSRSTAVSSATTHNLATAPGNANGGAQAGGTGGGTALGWKTPKPPYPRIALLARAQGTTTVHFTTDALGNVASAMIVRSTGNAALDAATLSYVRNNWKGPANSARTTEFVYQLP